MSYHTYRCEKFFFRLLSGRIYIHTRQCKQKWNSSTFEFEFICFEESREEKVQLLAHEDFFLLKEITRMMMDVGGPLTVRYIFDI